MRSVIDFDDSEDLVLELFRRAVPEIQAGTVDVRAVARLEGTRTKVAVETHDVLIDPVSACVGRKAERVKAVVEGLGGERVDIVPYSTEPERFITLALAPARVVRVMLAPDGKRAVAVVPTDEMSTAMGVNGLNRDLASRLTGYDIELVADQG